MWTERCFWTWTWNIGSENEKKTDYIQKSLLCPIMCWGAECERSVLIYFVSLYACDSEQRELWWLQRRKCGMKKVDVIAMETLRRLTLPSAALNGSSFDDALAQNGSTCLKSFPLTLNVLMAFSSHCWQSCAFSAQTFFHIHARSQWDNLVPCIMPLVGPIK